MLRISGSIVFAMVAVFFGSNAIFMSGQQKVPAVNPSAAPVPSPILNGKRAFVSFELGNGEQIPQLFSGGPERAYSEFYKEMKLWGRYQVVNDPKDADVIFAVRYLGSIPGPRQFVQLSISDPVGHVSLWEFVEGIDVATSKKNRDANFTATIERLVNDVKMLLSSNGTQAVAQP
jgi:hypothetical protein